MSRNRHQTIMKHLKLDKVFSRIQRRRYDKFCLISDTWNLFIDNCQKCYSPSVDLIIDEQLFRCKIRCPFIQYMPNKTDKLKMKFWLLAEVDSKYLCNGKLGKDSPRQKGNNLSTDIYLTLLEPYFRKDYNLTNDNFFTSIDLVKKLLVQWTTIVDTIRKQKRELPNTKVLMKNKRLFSFEILSSSSKCLLTVYIARKKKLVYVLSSVQQSAQ